MRPFSGGGETVMVKIFVLIAMSVALFFAYPLYTQSQPSISVSAQQNNQQPTESTNKQAKINNDNGEAFISPLKEIISHPQNHNTKDKGNQYHHWYDTFLNRTTDWLLVLFNFLLVLFTGTLACYTARLWKATVGLWKISQQHMIISERAYVFVKRYKVITNNGPHKITIIPEWHNNGSTQANYLLTCANGKYFPLTEYPTGIPDDYTFPDLIEGENWPTMLGPKGTFYADELNFNEEIVNATLAGHGRIYVWGWAEYNNLFDNIYRHRTEFCSEVVIKSIDAQGIRIGFHKQHNGADDYCFKKPMTQYPRPT